MESGIILFAEIRGKMRNIHEGCYFTVIKVEILKKYEEIKLEGFWKPFCECNYFGRKCWTKMKEGKLAGFFNEDNAYLGL